MLGRGLLDPKEFFNDPESEKVISLESSIKEVREEKDELIRMRNDEAQREIYEMRSKILKDKVSALNKARKDGIQQGIKQGIQQGIIQGREEGIKEGIKEGMYKAAKRLKQAGVAMDVIQDTTGLTIEEIKVL